MIFEWIVRPVLKVHMFSIVAIILSRFADSSGKKIFVITEDLSLRKTVGAEKYYKILEGKATCTFHRESPFE